MTSPASVTRAVGALLLLALTVVTSLSADREVELHENKRIVNGDDARPGAHPYIVSLQKNWHLGWKTFCAGIGALFCKKFNSSPDDYPDEFIHDCGGSLIAESWVLTAAHCVDFTRHHFSPPLKIVLGEHHLSENSSTEVERGVKAIIRHPHWSGEKFDQGETNNDIALIELSSPVSPSNHVQFAKLSQNDTQLLNNQCVLVGWGRNTTSGGSPVQLVLQEVHMDLLTFDDCWIEWKKYNIEYIYESIKRHHANFLKNNGIKEAWAKFRNDSDYDMTMYTNRIKYLSNKQICVVDRTPADGHGSACYGDSGGPMMCGRDRNILAGVTSWGEKTCKGRIPNVYTRVSGYTCWIQQHTGIQM